MNDANSERRLPPFQLLLHPPHAVFQLFGSKVFPHAVHFDRETERSEPFGIGDHNAGMLDSLQHVAQAHFFHLLIEYFLVGLAQQYIVWFIFTEYIEEQTC